MRFKFIGKSLYFEKEKILVLGDLHIGYEEYLNEQGIFVPRVQFKEIKSDLEKIFEKVRKVDKIIILGDLKHEFGSISPQEWREVKEILDFLKEKSKMVVLVKGNHDTILEPIAKIKDLNIVDYYIEKNICFLHGQKLFPECLGRGIELLVLGHRHPAIVLFDEYKRERYKCFLVGKWKEKEVVILPSFFPFVEGSEIDVGGNLFIPERELKNFEVFVVGEEVYGFGRLKKMI